LRQAIAVEHDSLQSRVPPKADGPYDTISLRMRIAKAANLSSFAHPTRLCFLCETLDALQEEASEPSPYIHPCFLRICVEDANSPPSAHFRPPLGDPSRRKFLSL